MNIVLPHLLGQAIDAYVVPGDLPGLARISLIMLGLYALSTSLMWLQSYIMADASQRAMCDTQVAMRSSLLLG